MRDASRPGSVNDMSEKSLFIQGIRLTWGPTPKSGSTSPTPSQERAESAMHQSTRSMFRGYRGADILLSPSQGCHYLSLRTFARLIQDKHDGNFNRKRFR